MPFIDFKAIKAAVSIEDAASLLKLSLKKHSNQLPASCPACGNEDERIVVITPSRGLFYCFDAKVGGDCLALVQHVTGLDVQDAAAFLSPTGAAHNSPFPEQKKAVATKKEVAFDPVAFAAKLTFSDEVEALGLTEETATKLGVGWHPQRKAIYFPQKGRHRLCVRLYRLFERGAQNATALVGAEQGCEIETRLRPFGAFSFSSSSAR